MSIMTLSQQKKKKNLVQLSQFSGLHSSQWKIPRTIKRWVESLANLAVAAVCLFFIQARETCLATSSGRRWLWLRPAPTCGLSPTATSTSSSATPCRRCWSSTRPSPTTSPEICSSPTTCGRGWVASTPSSEGLPRWSSHSPRKFVSENTLFRL